MTKAFALLDWAVIASYFIAVLVIGSLASGRQKGDRSFFLGNRNMPTWAVAISILASSLSAVTFLGAPQEAFKGDLSYLILNVGGIIGAFVIAYFLIPIFYSTNTLTIYGYLEGRFGVRVRILAGISFLFGRLFASGARLFAAALGASLLIHGGSYPNFEELSLIILVLGIVGTAYTLFGGIRAVIWTDVLQFSIVLATIVISIGFLLHEIPLSFSEIFSRLASSSGIHEGTSKLTVIHNEWNLSSPYTLLTGTFAIVFLNIASYGVDHDLVQRMLTCKSAWKGGFSLVSSIFISVFVVALFMSIGLLLYLFNQPDVMGDKAAQFVHSELVYPQFLISYLPAGLSGLAIAGLFAVCMGSLDSAINAMASSAVADVWRPIKNEFFGSKEAEMQESLKSGRVGVAIAGGALMLFAILAAFTYDPKNSTLLGFALGVMTYAYSGLLGVFLSGIFTKRGNTKSAILALIVGPIVVLLLQPAFLPKWLDIQIAWPWWMVFGTTVSFITCTTGSPVAQESKELFA